MERLRDVRAYGSSTTRKRGWRFLRPLLFSALLILLITGIAWVVVWSPVFRVTEVRVEGGGNVPADEIRSLARGAALARSVLARWLGDGNLLSWPRGVSPAMVATVPRLTEVSVEKDFRRRTLLITAVERTPYGIWCVRTASPPRCFWFDDNGLLFAPALAVEGNLIPAVNDYYHEAIGIGSTILPDEFVANLLSVFEVIRASPVSVREVRFEKLSRQEVAVRTYDGPTLYFSLRYPANAYASVVSDLFERPGFRDFEYADFRVENRVYYK